MLGTCLPALTRRALVIAVLMLAALLPSRSLNAQAAQAPAKRVFGSDAGMIFNNIKPDKTGDFEMVVAKLKEALAKSKKPERQEQAASWKVFKSVEPGAGGSVLYIFLMDPVVKGADYTVSTILNEAFPADVQQLYTAFAGAYAGGQSFVNLTLVSAMK